ncbi:MAG: glycosyltransferase family 4 protein [Methanomassiliicoccales archaeon]|nr:MAG: glycosyltransferase family 4 protein [Methanomassiliicoccales archaeon]
MRNENPNKKTVCMPVYSFYPFDPRVRRAAEALLEKGYSVDIICLKEKGDKKVDSFNDVNIHRVSLTHKRGGYLRYFYHYTSLFLQVFMRLNSLDRKKKYDVVHVHSLPDFLVFIAVMQKLKKRKIILDLHEVMPEIYAARFNKKMDSFPVKIVCMLERISTRFADRVITVNDVRKEVIINRGVPKEKIVVIMNAPDENLSIKKDLEDFKAKLHLEHKFITVYVGGINYERNLEVVLKAMSIVKKDIPNIYFIIFGHTYGQAGLKYIEELKALAAGLGISENVYFGGQLAGEDVASYIELADFGIVSYVKNPMTELAMPNKVFEYIMADKPIISCRLKGLYKLLGEEATIYYQPENHDDLAKKIKWLYNNRNEVGKMVENARKIYVNNSWSVMKRRLHDMYKNL